MDEYLVAHQQLFAAHFERRIRAGLRGMRLLVEDNPVAIQLPQPFRMLGARRIHIGAAKAFDLPDRSQRFLKLGLTAARIHRLAYSPINCPCQQPDCTDPKPTSVPHRESPQLSRAGRLVKKSRGEKVTDVPARGTADRPTAGLR